MSTIVQMRKEGWEFEDNFMRIVMQYNREDWERSYVWPTQWMKSGIKILHTEPGNIGRSKAISASVKYGFDKWYAENQTEISIMEDKYNDILRGPDFIQDSVLQSNYDASHMRDTVGSREYEFHLPPADKGLMQDVSDLLGFNLSQMYRHLIAIALNESESYTGWTSDAVVEYDQFLQNQTQVRARMIESALDMIDEVNGDKES